MKKPLTPAEVISVEQISTFSAAIECAAFKCVKPALRQLRNDQTLSKIEFQDAIRKTDELNSRLIPLFKELVIEMADDELDRPYAITGGLPIPKRTSTFVAHKEFVHDSVVLKASFVRDFLGDDEKNEPEGECKIGFRHLSERWSTNRIFTQAVPANGETALSDIVYLLGLKIGTLRILPRDVSSLFFVRRQKPTHLRAVEVSWQRKLRAWVLSSHDPLDTYKTWGVGTHIFIRE